ncbi:DUF4082 domain-containing protein [Actinocrispum sp. NPDC049592]|uniref:DUF4082 domain-containing protein n=1 Tax=Actinocrispum sp. NPDC049592 TaxID=3154835 RepID=UPI00344ACFB8
MITVLVVPVGVAHADYPIAHFTSPTSGASVDAGTPVLLAGVAVNGEAGGVVSVEVSSDGGETWEQAEYADETWSYLFTPTEPGTVNLYSRASTSTTVGVVNGPVVLHVGEPGTVTPLSGDRLRLPSLPGKPRINEVDDQPVEVGVRTRLDQGGHITGAIIYRGSYSGPVTLRVWGPDGTLLGEQAAGSEVYAQRITLSTPVPAVAGTDYVVSYYTPSGGYAQTEEYYSGAVITAPFTAPPAAGVYHYGVDGGFPTDTWHNANYWVMPLFGP